MKSALSDFLNHSFPQNPILIIDKGGLVGEPLSLKLSKEFLVIFVSQKKTEIENRNIIHVPFSGKFPVIPDNKYSQIILINEEGRDLEFLPKLIDKVKDINADFIFAQGLSAEGGYTVNKILRLYRSAKIVLFGDIFGNELILRKKSFKSTINKFIYQAQKFGKIQVLGEGLKQTYPVHLNDVVEGLIDLVFGLHKSHSLFYIFPKHLPSELSLAHMIQKPNPEITIDFIRHDPRLGKISYPSNGLNLLGEKYPIARKIRDIDIKKKVKARDEGVDEDRERPRGFPLFTIWTLIFLLLTPFIFTVFFSFLGLGTFSYAKVETNKGNLASARSSLHLSQTFFYLGKQASNILSLQAKIIGTENNLKRLQGDIDLGYKISQSLFQAFSSEIYFSKILSGKSESPADDLEKGENHLKSSILILNNVMAEEKIPAAISQSLEKINPLIKFLSNALEVMPNILGMEGPKTYLILFQDNMKLRPGGGIINSYGILKMNMGRIAEFSIHDMFDADSQLRGHVEPPFAIRRYLLQQHWYMKDSNFNVDFVKSASSASNFLFVETGQKADGVIAIDTSFIKSVLKTIGPVSATDYKEIIDENNFYKPMQLYAEKDFSKSLYKTIIEKTTEEKVSYFSIAQVISDALMQKHLTIAFNADFQNIFTVNGWSSSLWDERIDNEELINDFLGISEANLGISNVNYFIKRQVSQKVTIGEDGNISEEITISYKSDSAVSPGAEYKNYLRIILPKNASLSEISINDQPKKIISAITDSLIYEARNFKAPQGLEIEKTQENGKEIFGFMVKVPAGEIVKIKIKHDLPGSVSKLNSFSYNLKLFKQPGTDSLPYSFTLVYPNFFNIIKSSSGVTKDNKTVAYSRKIVEDKNLIIDFIRK